MQPMTFGVEEEFLVIDAYDGELVPRSKELLPEARLTLGEEVSPELNLCQIEVGTPVCREAGELREHLVRLRRGLCLAAADIDLNIAATGTHPFTSWTDQQVDYTSDRFSRIEDLYKIVARQQVICGCHVHVGIDDPDLAIQVMNHVRPHLGTLLALSANSPFWQGIDTGYDSYRMQVWERWPTAGLPPALADRAAYDELVTRLEGVEAIEDATFLYWHVRPSVQYPTLEFRIGDVCLHVDDTVAYASLIRGLAWSTAQRILAGEDLPPPRARSHLLGHLASGTVRGERPARVAELLGAAPRGGGPVGDARRRSPRPRGPRRLGSRAGVGRSGPDRRQRRQSSAPDLRPLRRRPPRDRPHRHGDRPRLADLSRHGSSITSSRAAFSACSRMATSSSLSWSVKT